MLSKIIIFVTRNNEFLWRMWRIAVVNCFQKLLSSWRGTTYRNFARSKRKLWIAFKNYYLRDEEQLKFILKIQMQRCELLSKIIIFVTRNNNKPLQGLLIIVVNCFQKLLSSWRGTTRKTLNTPFGQLWIAFKNYYLRDEEQLLGDKDARPLSCELLSKIIIFVTRNNLPPENTSPIAVVNCFQKLLSSWRGTTALICRNTPTMLWIAFKNYYLRDEEQPALWLAEKHLCCELLSKIIIFVTRNNDKIEILIASGVVNCFQKLLSSWRGTTRFRFINQRIMLWIAFKNYYLRDEEQLSDLLSDAGTSCELLSKIIIFVTRNNQKLEKVKIALVVNCFQKLLSSWRGTTWEATGRHRDSLWIAFKNYYLRDEEQRATLTPHILACCELLSKIIIFVTRNNLNWFLEPVYKVVNCFQKLLSSWRGTTLSW